MSRVGGRFRGGDEARAHPHPVSSLAQQFGDTLRGRNSARGHHRHPDRGQHPGQQLSEGHGAAHMPARLDALRDHEVTPCIDRRGCLRRGSHLPSGQRAAAVDRVHQLRVGVAIEKLDDPGTTRRLPDLFHVRVEGNQEVLTARPWRRFGTPVHHPEAPRADNHGGQLGGTHAAHRRQLDRQPAPDEVGEARGHAHCSR